MPHGTRARRPSETVPAAHAGAVFPNGTGEPAVRSVGVPGSTAPWSVDARCQTVVVTDEYRLHRERRGLFDQDVAAYEQGRPPYPPEVLALLRSAMGLASGARVLEIGPGPGLATAELLDAGAAVTAVELSPVFADHLEARFAGRDLTVIRGPFEHSTVDEASFDLVVAATSFHWVVPNDEALVRSADALRPGGWLALWWNVFGDHERPDPFYDAVEALLRRIEPALADRPEAGSPGPLPVPYALDVAARVGELDRSGRFGPVRHKRFVWSQHHSTEDVRAQFASFSPWLALPSGRREVALDALARLVDDEFGGIVERLYVTPIYLAQRH